MMNKHAEEVLSTFIEVRRRLHRECVIIDSLSLAILVAASVVKGLVDEGKPPVTDADR